MILDFQAKVTRREVHEQLQALRLENGGLRIELERAREASEKELREVDEMHTEELRRVDEKVSLNVIPTHFFLLSD